MVWCIHKKTTTRPSKLVNIAEKLHTDHRLPFQITFFSHSDESQATLTRLSRLRVNLSSGRFMINAAIIAQSKFAKSSKVCLVNYLLSRCESQVALINHRLRTMNFTFPSELLIDHQDNEKLAKLCLN
jgi:hypothetical protein